MIKKIAIILFLLLQLPLTGRATTVVPLELDAIIDTATTAFEGKCIENRTELDPQTNFVVTYTTFEVKDALKGDVKSRHVIKQLGGTMPDGQSGYKVDGVPTFTVGQDYVVFLAGVSSIGFSSPIGLWQGKFSIQEGASGKTVSNGRDFREMKVRTPSVDKAAVAEAVQRLGLDEFKQVARRRVAANLQ